MTRRGPIAGHWLCVCVCGRNRPELRERENFSRQRIVGRVVVVVVVVVVWRQFSNLARSQCFGQCAAAAKRLRAECNVVQSSAKVLHLGAARAIKAIAQDP